MSARPYLGLALVISALLFPASAGAQAPAPAPSERYIAVTGTGRANVEPPRERTDRTIARAVERASLAALPRAIAAARQRAAVAAQAAGLGLGPILSVDESRFGPFPFESFGRFGPGRYCGTVTLRIFAPRRPGEPPRVVRRVRERRCFVPPQATVIAVVTFAVT